MDVAGIAEVATDSRILLPLLASGAAGLSFVALMFGVGRLQRKALAADFPKDDDAAQSKYLLAFNQLTEMQIDQYAKLTAPSEASRAAEFWPWKPSGSIKTSKGVARNKLHANGTTRAN